MVDDTEIKSLIQAQGKAFEAFKATNDEMIAEQKRLGSTDTLLTDKLNRIDAALNAQGEAKAALEAAQAKQFEDLEKEIGRLRAGASGGTPGAGAIDVKTFNAHRAARGLRTDVSEAEAKEYALQFCEYLRKGDGTSDAERKAMSVGSDPDGGYLVTPDISGRIVKKVFETSAMREHADSQTIGTDALEGSKDINEGQAGWVGESDARVVSSTPQVGVWRIPVHEMYAMPDATQKMLDDANMNIEAWLAAKTGDKMGRMENTAFVVGNGVTQPRGFASYATAATADATRTWGTFEHKATGVSGDFAAAATQADVLFDVIHAMKPAYLAGAKFFMPRLVVAKIRKFKEATTNAYMWQPSLAKGEPETLLGYPLAKLEDMAALGANSLSIAFGDMRMTYQIVDRAGVHVIRDPYTAKPFVRFYTSRRVGGDVLNFETLKFVKFI